QFCLAELVMDRNAPEFAAPFDNFRVQRFPRARSDSQKVWVLPGDPVSGGLHRTVGGWGRGKVGDLVLAHDPEKLTRSERSIEKHGRLAHEQRSDEIVIEAVGPARVGHIPEHVVFAKIQAEFHVSFKGSKTFHRDVHTLWIAGRAGRV